MTVDLTSVVTLDVIQLANLLDHQMDREQDIVVFSKGQVMENHIPESTAAMINRSLCDDDEGCQIMDQPIPDIHQENLVMTAKIVSGLDGMGAVCIANIVQSLYEWKANKSRDALHKAKQQIDYLLDNNLHE